MAKIKTKYIPIDVCYNNGTKKTIFLAKKIDKSTLYLEDNHDVHPAWHKNVHTNKNKGRIAKFSDKFTDFDI